MECYSLVCTAKSGEISVMLYTGTIIPGEISMMLFAGIAIPGEISILYSYSNTCSNQYVIHWYSNT